MDPLPLTAMPLSGQQLPTLRVVYQHSLRLAVVKKASGEWIQKTTRGEKAINIIQGEFLSILFTTAVKQ